MKTGNIALRTLLLSCNRLWWMLSNSKKKKIWEEKKIKYQTLYFCDDYCIWNNSCQQRGSIGLCGWSSPCLPRRMLPWRSERSSSWTPVSRNRRSSIPPGSTDPELFKAWTGLPQASAHSGCLLFFIILCMCVSKRESDVFALKSFCTAMTI